ncbi:MAG: phosphoglycerate kinase [Patescibacteria group bacterium]
MILPSICEISNWQTKIVFVRASINVPLTETGEIADDYRLERILPTLHYLVDQEAIVIIIAHQGREKTEHLQAVYERLKQEIELDFFENFFAQDFDASLEKLREWIAQAEAGAVVLLDNVRATDKEKANDEDMASKLALLGELYINEAFAASHRKHMSLDALPRKCTRALAGFTCSEEVENLQIALEPRRGSVAIIGGNKASTKLPLIRQLLDSYEAVYVGGALANTLYKLAGYEIGRSVYEDKLDEDTQELAHLLLGDARLILPSQVVCEDSKGEVRTKDISLVAPDDAIYDIATEDITNFIDARIDAPLLVWNGPLGYLEGGYKQGTIALAEKIKEISGESIVGGGNTIDLLREHNLDQHIDFLSTGGGAMIHYLTHKSLPALYALH